MAGQGPLWRVEDGPGWEANTELGQKGGALRTGTQTLGFLLLAVEDWSLSTLMGLLGPTYVRNKEG